MLEIAPVVTVAVVTVAIVMVAIVNGSVDANNDNGDDPKMNKLLTSCGDEDRAICRSLCDEDRASCRSL